MSPSIHCDPVRSALVGTLFLLAAAGCGTTAQDAPPAAPTGGAAGAGASGGGAGAGGGPQLIAEMSFAAPEPWAKPIEDYLDAGEAELGNDKFLRAVQDLAVYDDRLCLAYGDANEDLGDAIPIGFRYFASAEQPKATNELDSDEQQLVRYRALGGRLFMAGVDPTEDGFVGNVYFRGPKSSWVKRRTVVEGVHVHDVAELDGALYAVGSGATEQEWNNGDVYAELWRSTDEGKSFESVERVDNGGDGDARWVRLLPLPGALYVFGYTSDANFEIDALIGARYDGAALELLPEDHPLRWVYVTETDLVPGSEAADSFGLVRGIGLAEEPLRSQSWRAQADGTVEPIDGLAGQTVVDVFVHEPTGESLLLVYEGDDYLESLQLSEWQVRFLVTADFEQFTELVSFSTQLAPWSLAYWQGHLFYGTDGGQIWRASPKDGAGP
ncbi:MAG: hypothetical protein HY744_09815 [Deltaproteobacteria bacterium]|nr:hypothetical protein [Deltaproteobacteria bacterium]